MAVPAFQRLSSNCNAQNIHFTKAVDTTSTATADGIFTASASCAGSSTWKITAKLRGISGSDGYVRYILVAALDPNWQLSGSAFQKMLDSLDQTSDNP